MLLRKTLSYYLQERPKAQVLFDIGFHNEVWSLYWLGLYGRQRVDQLQKNAVLRNLHFLMLYNVVQETFVFR